MVDNYCEHGEKINEPCRDCIEDARRERHRIATLESQLAEAERTIAELQSAEATWRMAKTEAQNHADRMQAERDEARRVAVWAVIHSSIHYKQRLLCVVDPDDPDARQIGFDTDDTDSGIYAALRRAMGESDAD